MIILAETKEEQISQLIGTTIEQLDITSAAFEAAEGCYRDLGSHLSEANAEVHVQGSFLLGTVVRPHQRGGEYDLDLVSRLDVAKISITQQELKDGDKIQLSSSTIFKYAYQDAAENVFHSSLRRCDSRLRP